MASKILGIANKLRNLTDKAAVASLRRSMWTETSSSHGEGISRGNLFSRLSSMGDPSFSAVPVLDQWAKECSKINVNEVRYSLRTLRSKKRYVHALQVSEWLSSKDSDAMSSGDCAVQLDLIGKVRGVESAENYFNSMSDVNEKRKLYGALLYCYVAEAASEKALSLMKTIKELGFTTTLTYNSIITLYKNTGQVDKISEVLLEMKKDGFLPDKGTYGICIHSYGLSSDFEKMEKILEEMESQQPRISPEWGTYSMVADFYLKSGDLKKGLIHLEKCEGLVGDNSLGYGFLITNYAKLGRKDEVMRLWGLQKANCRKQLNRDYISMIVTLLKLDDLEEAERVLAEWESSCHFYDLRVPNSLLFGYCKKGLSEKAESMVLEIVAKGKNPIPNSWSIVATGYFEEKNMVKAYESMKKALALQNENIGWKPKPIVPMAILDWLVDHGTVEEVEAFMGSMKNVVPVSKEMYHALIKSYIRHEEEVDGVLERMEIDGIGVDQETKNLIKISN